MEDWYQGTSIPRDLWHGFEDRVERGLNVILEVLAASESKGTFFFLGAVAEAHPELVRRVGEAGHEIGTHGCYHRTTFSLTRKRFAEDLLRSIQVIEDACGQKVRGYRAPYFSITRRSLWAFDVMLELGLEYDSSVAPIHHHRCGIPYTPRFSYAIKREGGSIVECPLTTVRTMRRNIPMFGGFYFRLFPFPAIAWGARRIHNEGHPAIFYLHPWEFDPDHPRIKMRPTIGIPHYWNLRSTEQKLRLLVREFDFGSIADTVLPHKPELMVVECTPDDSPQKNGKRARSYAAKQLSAR